MQKNNILFLSNRLALETTSKELGTRREDEPDKVFYRGVAASTKTDSYYEELDISTLQNMAKELSDIPVVRQHSLLYENENPIGRTFKGNYRLKKTYAEFFIQDDVDAGIEMNKLIAGGTMKELSPTIYNYKEYCNECGERMKYFSCKNGHYAGQEKANGKRVTTTIKDGHIFELSVVARPANTDAQIEKSMKSLVRSGKIDIGGLETIERRFGLSAKKMKSYIPISKSIFDFGGSKVDDKKTKLSDMNEEELISELEDAYEEIKSLKEAKPDTSEEVDAEIEELAETISTLQEEVEKGEVENAQLTMMAEQGELALKELRKKAEEIYVKRRGVSLVSKETDIDYKTKKEVIDNNEDVLDLFKFIKKEQTLFNVKTNKENKGAADDLSEDENKAPRDYPSKDAY